MKNRSKFNYLYIRVGKIGDPCYYCGVSSSDYDHVPPVHYVTRMVSELVLTRGWFFMYPCCKECNSFLGGDITRSVSKRRQIVRKKLRLKYASILNTAPWTIEELREMSLSMKEFIKLGMQERYHIEARLAYYRVKEIGLSR